MKRSTVLIVVMVQVPTNLKRYIVGKPNPSHLQIIKVVGYIQAARIRSTACRFFGTNMAQGIIQFDRFIRPPYALLWT
jgi:hypothetical protein